MPVPYWKLPAGVTRSLWEFAHDPQIAAGEADHLADSPLLGFDRRILRDWFPTPGNLIDLGCGTGRLLMDFAGRGFRCLGVDLSPDSLRCAHQRLNSAGLGAQLVRANLCDLGCVAEARFDVALLMFGTLGMICGREHRQTAMAQIRRVLKTHAKLALHVHSVWRHLDVPAGRRWLLADLWKRVRRDPTAGDTNRDYRGVPRMYHHVFTRRELTRLVESSGFALRECVPLAAEPAQDELRCRGAFTGIRCTGWLVLAEAVE